MMFLLAGFSAEKLSFECKQLFKDKITSSVANHQDHKKQQVMASTYYHISHPFIIRCNEVETTPIESLLFLVQLLKLHRIKTVCVSLNILYNISISATMPVYVVDVLV